MAGPSDIERLATTRGLLALALPMATSMGIGFFLQFINRLFLGWHSPEALAASMPAGMLAWSFQSFFVLSAAYVGTFAAQHHAAGEDHEAGAMCWPALWLGVAACLLSLLCIPARFHLVALFDLQDSTVATSMANLLAWYLADTGPLVIMAAISGFYAGLGRTMWVLILSVSGGLVSIPLNYWLIFGGLGVPSLGVTGAGLATIITSLVMLLAWGFMFFTPTMRHQFGTWRNRNGDLRRIVRFCRFGLPRGASEVLEMFAFLIFTAAITRLPTASVNASNIALSLYLLVLVPFVGLGQGVSIAVGQCMGAGRPDVARRVGWRAVMVVTPPLFVIALLFLLCPRQLMAIYTAATDIHDAAQAQIWKATLDQAVPVLGCLALATVADGLHWVFRMVVVGAGDTRWTLVAMVTCGVVFLSIPVWWMLRVADPSFLISWGLTPLTASYGCMALYCWIISGVIFLRFQYGPWPTMSVRH